MALVPKPRDIRSLHHIYKYLHAVIKMSLGCFIHSFTFLPPTNVGKGQLRCFQTENAPLVSTRRWRGCPRKQCKQEGTARLPSELAVRIVFRPLALNETVCAWPTAIVNRRLFAERFPLSLFGPQLSPCIMYNTYIYIKFSLPVSAVPRVLPPITEYTWL